MIAGRHSIPRGVLHARAGSFLHLLRRHCHRWRGSMVVGASQRMIYRVAVVIALCFPLYGCGIGAFYCLEKASDHQPSPFCDIW